MAAKLTETVSFKVQAGIPRKLRELAFDKRMTTGELLRTLVAEKLVEAGSNKCGGDSGQSPTWGGGSMLLEAYLVTHFDTICDYLCEGQLLPDSIKQELLAILLAENEIDKGDED
jgi:hypothetical protein